MSKIKKAAIKVSGKIYTGDSHPQAMHKAWREGKSLAGVNRERDGKFLTSDGRIISRSQAKKEFGITHSEEVPKLLKGRFKTNKQSLLHDQFGHPVENKNMAFQKKKKIKKGKKNVKK